MTVEEMIEILKSKPKCAVIALEFEDSNDGNTIAYANQVSLNKTIGGKEVFIISCT